jgi:hypothetical protein
MDRQVFLTQSVGIGGYAEKWLVLIKAGETRTFSFSFPLDHYYVPDASEKLSDFVTSHAGRLRFELHVRKEACTQVHSGYFPNRRIIEEAATGEAQEAPCWSGMVVSNALQLPVSK